jgi:hypothetical protein
LTKDKRRRRKGEGEKKEVRGGRETLSCPKEKKGKEEEK